MSKRRTEASADGAVVAPTEEARCLRIAERGIKTSKDFRDFMSALMSDLVSQRVTPQIGNATCNAGGKMLKMVDLEYTHGTRPERKHAVLTIAYEEPEDQRALPEGRHPEAPNQDGL